MRHFRPPNCRRSVYQIYEALNFCGVPIGFVTEEQIAAEGVEAYDCLITGGARTLLTDSAQAIREFKNRGGRLVFYGKDNFIEDEYGRSAEPVTPASVIPANLTGEPLRDRFSEELAQAGIVPRFTLGDGEDGTVYGVEWRDAQLGPRGLLNVVNHMRHDVEVRLPEGVWRDLIRDEPASGKLTLKPNQPHLFERIARD